MKLLFLIFWGITVRSLPGKMEKLHSVKVMINHIFLKIFYFFDITLYYKSFYDLRKLF